MCYSRRGSIICHRVECFLKDFSVLAAPSPEDKKMKDEFTILSFDDFVNLSVRDEYTGRKIIKKKGTGYLIGRKCRRVEEGDHFMFRVQQNLFVPVRQSSRTIATLLKGSLITIDRESDRKR